ncbi:hypothetical protein H6F78_04865 [Coleofasciculus sp. FACHB-64]|uniref:hypothetical protein n=1 Tax=Cyanophyceae TaxID=3028117 RepID=UPI001683A555|nr:MULTISPECIES: hypothetical protein [unclassified Coleofasciculus]MBD1840077.1 hypothetical protein [Coleofasciculus sp. FACHB-501]MBD1880497.1 hypothetical protein [Coleofasciculus sp. FACHB-T130]MBD1892238.1 hypothetical protein [Coleofasciculus sp. FACHB-SPT9]MBD1893845.1 hypothetical protein [Coleofasciculus sp. FACHB-129]MBD1900864.1 hypothetical protein [Coleofasciculus sp. FACHB-125]
MSAFWLTHGHGINCREKRCCGKRNELVVLLALVLIAMRRSPSLSTAGKLLVESHQWELRSPL